MNDLLIASTAEDARAVDAVVDHHAQLAGALAARCSRVVTAVTERDEAESRAARDDLVAWLRSELLPHARAEEASLYDAGLRLAGSRVLVEAMVEEHRVLTALVEEIATEPHPVRLVGATRALQVLFETHLDKENDRLLPLLAAESSVSVAQLLDGMHEVLGGHDHPEAPGPQAPAHGHGDCGCGEVDGPGYPELDARAVPHAIRHATVFGALDAVAPGSGMVLVAPHDPLPLLAQAEARDPGAFEVSYLERGPEAWRLLFRRRTAVTA